jgi:hypothetical protein
LTASIKKRTLRGEIRTCLVTALTSIVRRFLLSLTVISAILGVRSGCHSQRRVRLDP